MIEQDILLTKKPIFMHQENLPSLTEIFDVFQDFEVDCSTSGISTKLTIKKKLADFIEEDNDDVYVFHDIYRDKKMFKIIKEMIPPIKRSGMRISRLYVGNRGTGSHIHNHSVAINYLIYGQKIWVMFPNSRKNNKLLKDYCFQYGQIDEQPLNWFEKNRGKLETFENVEIVMQNTGDVFVVPKGYYHGVYNLTKVCGITYSWH